MNKSFIHTSFYFLILLMISCSAQNSNGNQNIVDPNETQDLLVKVKVNGFAGGTVKLLGMIGQNHYLADSAKADASGSMQFQRPERLPGGMYYVFLPNNKYFQILLDKDQHFEVETDISDFNSKTKITGSIDNKLLYDNIAYEVNHRKNYDSLNTLIKNAPEGSPTIAFLKHKQEESIEQREKLLQSYQEEYPNSFFTEFKMAGQNPKLQEPKKPNGEIDAEKQIYLYRMDFWKDVDFSDERLLRTPVYHNKLKRFMTELTPKIIDSLISSADYIIQKSKANKEVFKYTSNWIGLQYRDSDIMGGEAVYVHVIDKYFTFDQAFWSDSAEIAGLRKQALDMKPSLLGKIGQNLTCKDQFGLDQDLFDGKSELTVLMMWSYNCDNCKKEMPELKKVYAKYNSRVRFYAISTEHDAAAWKKFITDNQLPWINVSDNNYSSQYHKKYHLDVTPEIYVMDADRKIIGKNLKANQLETVFERVFKEKNNQ